MSLAPAAMPGQRAPSPGANANFASNNPFRRAASPLPSPDHRMSNNPFLDPPASSQQRQGGPNPFTEDIFKDLSLLDKPTSGAAPAPRNNGPPRSGTVSTSHRPARSQEEESRRRGPAPPRGPPRPSKDINGLDIFASPPKTESRRPRRNSESSILDSKDEDRRRRERRKEREERREKEGKSKDGKSRTTRKPQGLDLIDKLDVTGIYGQGLFHHDGPFDACNPHRNRKKDVRAPMQAFPADSANNALGGSGPLNKNIDLDRFHGRGEDAFNDYSQSRAQQLPAKHVQSFNPADRVEQIHTSESYGLGTSTFLEGAPASRKDLQRRESETEPAAFPGGGLTRKKSLAVRLRGLSQNRNNVASPDGNYGPISPNSPGQVQSAGGRTRIAATTKESNPFFSDYNDAYEKKGASIRYAEETKGGRARAPSSPHRNGLTRSITADSVSPAVNDMPEKSSGGGFLNRMKSLKGGRRARPERRGS
ncbi:Pal1-domain-containing protein [Aureobasidium pullulans]|uniref:Pal1-domain-containing protein n=1 Tax=Aureobasidium pullulans TaxID=5580 RepID=A0A4V4J8K5_AURPU|nr:Pal1-domain-containing protein [Aureobasidium pullulans]THX40428.1 Pal1-domain-containing protein [Aureobasidium pullulans]